MKLSLRLLLGYFIIVAVAAFFVFNTFVKEVKPGVRKATEDTLVDTANLLASIVSVDSTEGRVETGRLTSAMAQINHQPIDARISEIVKNRMEYRVYVTDAQGIVLYDSSGIDTGSDYSRWNDVYLTLRGHYGARSSRLDLEDENSSVMYVAAPIYIAEKIAGVLTVSKPNRLFAPIVQASERKILTAGGSLLGIAFAIGLLMVGWINRDISRLIRHAEAVGAGQAPCLPRLGSPEFTLLANSLEAMRRKLEGKEYVTRYVHTLMHELKSPLAAIRGAAEILLENPPPETARRFSENIAQQAHRVQHLIEKMLQQARVEAQLTLERERLDISTLALAIVENKTPQAAARNIRFNTELASSQIEGDALLLTQAITNLIDNALDFSPDGTMIDLSGKIAADGHYRLAIRDYGLGIPDYALDRVFERFYSLPRPNGAKSTGLGLSFVREVAERHLGYIEITNAPNAGAEAVLLLPCHPT